MPQPLTILKFGGSVLRDERDLRTAVEEIARWRDSGEKVIAVVSAFEGTTDRLLGEAGRLCPDAGVKADPAALAMLLATGEFTTAAKLTLALSGTGVPARLLGPAAAGLRTTGGGADADPARVDVGAVERAVREADAVVIPGFIATDPEGNLALLGRGGSDLTAIFLAHHLGGGTPDGAARVRCRLIKDVDGVYDADPNAAAARERAARRYRTLHYDDALRLDAGIIQHKAVRLARRLGVAFEVGAWARDDVTLVGSVESELEPARGEVGAAAA